VTIVVKYGSIKLNPSGAHVHSSSTLALRLLPTEIPSSSPVSGRQHTQRDSFLLENVLRLEKQKREERISKQFSILVLGFFPFFKVSNSFHIGLLASVPWTSCCNWVNLRISLISDCLFAVSLQFLGVRFDFVELLHVRPKFNRVTGRTFLSVMTPAALDGFWIREIRNNKA
jgi:hypothetical protein